MIWKVGRRFAGGAALVALAAGTPFAGATLSVEDAAMSEGDKSTAPELLPCCSADESRGAARRIAEPLVAELGGNRGDGCSSVVDGEADGDDTSTSSVELDDDAARRERSGASSTCLDESPAAAGSAVAVDEPEPEPKDDDEEEEEEGMERMRGMRRLVPRDDGEGEGDGARACFDSPESGADKGPACWAATETDKGATPGAVLGAAAALADGAANAEKRGGGRAAAAPDCSCVSNENATRFSSSDTVARFCCGDRSDEAEDAAAAARAALD